MIYHSISGRPYPKSLRIGLILCFLISVLLAAKTAQAQVNAGYRDFSFGASISTPTSDKPQSKLWWNDGVWWGILYNFTSASYDIYRFDLINQAWVDTGVAVDSRLDAHMDTLWDGQHVYVASGSLSGNALLYRYSYNPSGQHYTLDSGFPVTIRVGEAQSIAIARDSTGRLWITYTQNAQVWANHSLSDDTLWGAPFVLPVNGTSLTTDDVSSIVAFQGSKIGIMWSNELDKKDYFSVHLDTDPDTVWRASEVALPGTGQDPALHWADNHINLKSLGTDSHGRIYAAVKTSLNDATGADQDLPLIMLLIRDELGNWSSYIFSRIREEQTRPVVMIDEERSFLYLFATSPDVPGGIVYYKSTPLNNIQFPVGLGTPFISSATDTAINNATSTKQNLNSTTGLVVLASDDNSKYYLHNTLTLAAPLPLSPTADAYVRDGSFADTNFGAVKTLYVKSTAAAGFNRDSYFLFDTTGVAGSITSAQLRVWASLTGSDSFSTSLYAVPDTSWLESAITWNNRPALGGALGTALLAGTAYAWYTVDVTSYVQSEKAAGRNVIGLAFHGTPLNSNSAVQINSRESATNQPQLVVTIAAINVVPSPPSNLTATAVANNQINLTWADHGSNEDGFKIERSLNNITFTQIAMAGPNATSFADTGLTLLTTYYYRVRAFSTTGGNSTYTNTANATTLANPPAAPSSLAAAAISNSQIRLTWVDNSNNENGFKIERSTDNVNFTQIVSLGVNATSYTNSGLSPATTYYYRVRSYSSSGGNSAYSNTAGAATLPNIPAAPTTLTATAASYTQINLGWVDNSSNEDGFKIERSPNNVTYTQIATVGANSTSYQDTGLTPSTIYYYRVRAYNADGNSGYSNVSHATTITLPSPPAAPTNCAAQSVSSNQINVNWVDHANNEDGFKIERSPDNVTFTQIGATGSNSTAYQDTGLTPATSYYYRVRAYNAGGNSAYSNVGTATTAAVVTVSFLPAGDSYVRDGTFADTNYGAVDILNAKTSSPVGFNRDSYFKFDLSGVTGTIISSQLRFWAALNAADSLTTSLYSVPDASWLESAITWNNRPALGGTLDGVTINSTSYAWYTLDATSFIQSEKAAGRSVVSLALHNTLSSTGTVTLIYSKEAVSNQPQLVVTLAAASVVPNAPSSLAAAATSNTQIGLTWADNSNNEDGFKIERSIDNVTFAQVATIAANVTSYTDSGLTASTTYYYRVRAYNAGGGNSGYSNTASAVTSPNPPAAPGSLTAQGVSGTQINLAWVDNSGNEDGFKIERSTDNITFSQIATVASNTVSYQDSNLTPSSTYYYRVRAYNAGGASAYSNTASAATTALPSPPAAPSNLTTAALSSSQIGLAWVDNSSNEDGFKIERSTDNITFTQISTVGPNVTSYSDSALSPVTTYYYRIRAFNAGGNSGYTNVSSVTTASVVTASFTPVADSYVRDGTYADTNFGTVKILNVKTSTAAGYTRDSYFKFDISGITSHVTTAQLTVWASLNAVDSLTTSLYSVPDTSWLESGITWNNRPALGSALSSVTIGGTTYGWYTLDATSYVQSEQAAGRSVVSLALHNGPSTTGTVILLNSKEAATGQPQLVITY